MANIRGTCQEFENDFVKFRAEFAALPEPERIAVAPQVAPGDVEHVDPVDHYDKNVSGHLWGMSSVDWPITPDAASAVIADASGAGGARGGLTDRLSPIREKFLSKALQVDEGLGS